MARSGPDKEKCGAQLPNKPPGVTCRNVAGERTNHLGIGRCYRHGGCTQTHEASAEQVMEERRVEEIAKLAATFALPVEDMSPEDSLVWQHRELRRQITWVTSYIADLEADELFYGLVREKTGRETGTGTGQREGNTERNHATVVREMRIHAAVVVLGRWQHELHTLSVDILKLGLAERLVEMDEEMVRMVAEAWNATLADPVVTEALAPAQIEVVRQASDRHLRLVPPAA
jgi:hypothetical protein